jgi:transaldolase
MNIKIFADGANVGDMLDAYLSGDVSGFTTNPTLMRQAGVSDYEVFARTVLENIKDMPISFEVFSDDVLEMASQAKFLASLGDNVYVKIPITNTKGEFTGPLVKTLVDVGIKVNVTAIMTVDQLKNMKEYLNVDTPTVLSIFAGRIADTGIDPLGIMSEAVNIFSEVSHWEILWASPREVLNVYQAQNIGCDIITIIPSILKKLKLKDKDLLDYSLETVKMFYNDAARAGYKFNNERRMGE